MNKTNFSEKCGILSELWVYYDSEARENEAWSKFFTHYDVSLPLAFLLNEGIVLVSGDGKAEEYIDSAYETLCDYLGVDYEGWYRNLNEIFDASPNPPLEG